MNTNLEKDSLLKKKLKDRVRRSTEPFKGTLIKRKSKILSTSGNDPQTSEPVSSQGEKQVSFEKRLREKISSSTRAFCGSIGNPTKRF